MRLSCNTDLWIAALVISFASIVLALVVYRLGRNAAGWRLTIAATLLVCLLLVFGFVLADSTIIARILPFQTLPVSGNLVFPLSAMLGGILMRCAIPLWRRYFMLISLALVAFWSLFCPLFRPVPACANLWKDEVCLQTQQSSCSAAAAATLLRLHGIASSEQEMALLCLTSDKGTTSHGLYRGLVIKTRGTALRLKTGNTTVAELKASNLLPAIVNVRLSEQMAEKEPRYKNNWGWRTDVSHSVVLLSIGDGKVMVADPAFGLEHWDIQALYDLMTGEYVTLVH